MPPKKKKVKIKIYALLKKKRKKFRLILAVNMLRETLLGSKTKLNEGKKEGRARFPRFRLKLCTLGFYSFQNDFDEGCFCASKDDVN